MSVEILRDTFNRADGAVGTPDFGPAYSVSGTNGTANIVSNRLRLASTTAGGRVIATINTNNSGHGIHAKIAAANTGGGFYGFLALRAAGTIGTDGPISAIEIRFVSDSTAALHYTEGATGNNFLWATLPNWAVGDTWGLVAAGDYITVFQNERIVSSVISPTHKTNTRAGVAYRDSGNLNNSWIEFEDIRITRSQNTYPTPGMPRMAYDRDGSTFAHNTGAGDTVDLKKWNDNDGTTTFGRYDASNSAWVMGVLFPELRDVYAIHLHASAGITFYMQWSADTTNGINGTWANINTFSGTYGGTDPNISNYPGYRIPNHFFRQNGVRGIRFQATNDDTYIYVYTLHIYGLPTVNSNIHRIRFMHPQWDINLPPDYLDFDDILRGQIHYREFRIKNMSTVYTMNNIVLDIESLEYGTGSTDEYSIKRASESVYGPNTTIPSLAPGATSEIISVRRIVSGTSPFRIDAPRIRSQITSLS